MTCPKRQPPEPAQEAGCLEHWAIQLPQPKLNCWLRIHQTAQSFVHLKNVYNENWALENSSDLSTKVRGQHLDRQGSKTVRTSRSTFQLRGHGGEAKGWGRTMPGQDSLPVLALQDLRRGRAG